MKANSSPLAFYWFRRDLRLQDNTALFHALKSGFKIIPVFIFDKNILTQLEDESDARVNFIWQNLKEINEKLIKQGSSLLVRTGKPEEIWKKLMNEFPAEQLFFNHDYEPYAIKRDKQIIDLFKSQKKSVFTYKDHVIFEKDEILKDDGKPYTVFTPYSKKWFAKLNPSFYENQPSEKHLSNFAKLHSEFPSLSDIGFKAGKIKVPPADISKKKLLDYADSRNAIGKDNTTKTAAHLRFGTISIRELVRKSVEISNQYLTELAWREFFVQILYHFPHVVNHSFKSQYDNIKWDNNEKMFNAWCNAKTGYPLVDAGMMELNTTGFMHNRVRMVAASFLCKHLLIDWRWGEAYFAQKLLDYDISANNGNWQWAAGTGCDAAPYFRIFNPESQTQRFDPDMKYIYKWIPEYDPLSYIKPIIDHKFARERALRVYKEGLKA
jgi:deoxyribodipyrimidine photo-lyase